MRLNQCHVSLLHGFALTSLTTLVWAAQTPTETAPTSIHTAPYKQQIENLEREFGAVDPRLAEHFLSLGLAHRANGDIASAVGAFRQALHINRINKGLHHLSHVPIVDLLIDAYSTLTDWEAVEQQQRYRYWVHRRESDDDPMSFVDAAIKFAAWESRAYALDTGVAPFRQLRDSHRALDAAGQLLQGSTADTQDRLITILNVQALVNLNLARYMSNVDNAIGVGGPRSGEDVGDFIERRNIILDSFRRGKYALREVIEITRKRESQVEHGLALANLADWELLFDRTQTATALYREAYQQLRHAGLSEDELANELGRPRALTHFTLKRRLPPNSAEPSPRESDQTAYVTTSFRVTRSGRVRNIDVVDARPSENKSLYRQARRRLSRMRFRPSIVMDGPVAATSTLRYVFPDETI